MCTNRRGSVIVDFSLWVEDSVEMNILKDIFMRQRQFMIQHEVVDLQSLRLAGKLSNKIVKFPAVKHFKRFFWRIVYFRLNWGNPCRILEIKSRNHAYVCFHCCYNSTAQQNTLCLAMKLRVLLKKRCSRKFKFTL